MTNRERTNRLNAETSSLFLFVKFSLSFLLIYFKIFAIISSRESSGTTLLAAAKLGRKFIGNDSSEIAVNVIKNALNKNKILYK